MITIVEKDEKTARIMRIIELIQNTFYPKNLSQSIIGIFTRLGRKKS